MTRPTRLATFAVASALITQVAVAPRDAVDVLPPLAQPPAGAGLATVLVDVADDLDADERAAFVATLPGSPSYNSAFSDDEGLYRVALDAEDANRLVARLSGDRAVEFAELEGVYETQSLGTPDDPLYPFQWHLAQINAEQAWAAADGDGVVVAVIDTGVAFANDTAGRHRQVRDLSGNRFAPGYDFVSDDEEPFDEHGHGTHVAGTIAQTTNNAYGVAGVAPRARIMPIRVLDAAGRGNTADIAEAIRWAADNGADVINMSLGGPLPSRIMQDAVNHAHRKGVTIVAAAGNSGRSLPSFPAAYENVVAVAATQFDRTTTFYSNYGRYIDIAAPGGNVRVDQNDDGRPDGVMQETLARGNPLDHEFALYMGTSMASPHVAGVAALVHELGVTQPARVADVLEGTASRDVPSYKRDRFGAGLLDADAAVTQVLTRYRMPRAALALALAFAGMAFAGRRGGLRRISGAALAAGAVVGAAGLAPLALVMSSLGADASALAAFTTTPVHWPAAAGLASLADSALLTGVAPIVAIYAVAGATRRPVPAGFALGLMAGLAAFLVADALVPLRDVLGVPGVGMLDRIWLAVNGTIGALAVFAGLRDR